MDIFLANFFTAGALIPTFFHFYLAYLFLQSMPEKSKASFHLGVFFLYLGLFNFGYFIAGGFYAPGAAFHRWLTVGIILIAETHFNMFMFHIHDELWPRFTKAFLAVQYFLSVIITVIFFAVTYNADKVYHFDGHYWDFRADGISKIVGIVIFFYIIILICIMVIKVIRLKGRDRYFVLAIGIVYIVTSIVPSVVNILSRDGALDRGTFQVIWDLFNIIGFFFMAILYINYTKDRTTFMAKIVGISFVTLLVVLQGLSYYSFKDQEKAYDMIHSAYTKLCVEAESHSENTLYSIVYSPEENRMETLFGRDEKYKKGFLDDYRQDLYNSIIYERIKSALQNGKDRRTVADLPGKTGPFFQGYRALILDYLKKNQEGRGVLKKVDSVERKVLVFKNKISKIGEDGFRKRADSFLEKKGDNLDFFRTAMADYAGRNKNLEDEKLKRGMKRFLAPMKPAGSRHYRKIGGTHAIAFMMPSDDKTFIYEVGFDYTAYRKFLHPSAVKLIIMLIVIIFVVIVGFRFFFLGTLVSPLNVLLKGLQDVRKGNLEINVPIKVEDELGQLTHNFNQMVATIKSAKMELDEYAHGLEKMVDERTAKLKEVSDALWGEMQLAKKIQTVLLPDNPKMRRYEITGYMEPADEVGGDYYDIINGRDIDWVFIGDVSGHGVSAGIVMMMVQTAMQAILRGSANQSPSLLLKVADRAISYNINKMDEDKYMTITAFAFHHDGRVIFSGLHQDILIYRYGSGVVEAIETDGLWLGLSIDLNRKNTDLEFNLGLGDVVLLYTDGITEAMDEAGEMYGHEKLIKTFQESGQNSTEQIRDSILASLKGYHSDDDITMVVLKCVE